jgi:hypothetical protein
LWFKVVGFILKRVSIQPWYSEDEPWARLPLKPSRLDVSRGDLATLCRP